MNDVTQDMLIFWVSTMSYLSTKLFEREVKQFNLLLFFLFSPLNDEVSDSEDTQITIFRLIKSMKSKECANQFDIFKCISLLVGNTATIPELFQSWITLSQLFKQILSQSHCNGRAVLILKAVSQFFISFLTELNPEPLTKYFRKTY